MEDWEETRYERSEKRVPCDALEEEAISRSVSPSASDSESGISYTLGAGFVGLRLSIAFLTVFCAFSEIEHVGLIGLGKVVCAACRQVAVCVYSRAALVGGLVGVGDPPRLDCVP